MTRVNDILADLQARLAGLRAGRAPGSGDDKPESGDQPPLETGDVDRTSPSTSPTRPTPRMDSTTTSPSMPDDLPDHDGAASASSEVGGTAATDVATRYADLEARHAEVSDAYLRAKAESENVRRRAEDEIAKARKFAVESFAESLLPVKDSLESAIAIQAATPEQLLEGVHATLRQLGAALERNKVVEISPAKAEKFDPHRHQAISVVPADQEPNTVVTVLQKGYSIAERVLRPALVTVSAPRTT